MKNRLTFLLLVFMGLIQQSNAACNWKNRIGSLATGDSCKNNTVSKLYGSVSLNSSSCVQYTWEVNGVKISYGTTFNYLVPKNGSYLVCLKLVDTCNQCDTSICVTKNISCYKTCQWSKRNVSFSSWDSCNGIGYKYSINGSFTSNACYKYTWKVNGVSISTNRSLNYAISKNGTYNLCLTVNDTCDKCDTSYCRSFSITCVPSNCNWKNKNITLSNKDTCRGSNNRITGTLSFGQSNSCFKYNWTLNGSKISETNSMVYEATQNGTYNFCVKVTDTCNQCDTTLCFVKVISCIKTCKWFMRNNYYYSWDSCNGKGYKSSLNGAYTSKTCYKYTWKVNGSVVSNSSTLYYNVPKNGQYLVCLTVNDTCDKCDTTYCKTYNINCFSSSKCNWKSRNPYTYSWDTCKGKGYRNNVNAYISFNSNLNGCFKYNWTVNGKAAGTGNVVHYPVIENGTYTLCVKVTDTCNQCDTSFCMTRTISCFTQCNWKNRINGLIYSDSCNGRHYRNSLGGNINLNNNGCLKYNWTLNGVPVSQSSGFLAPIYLNGKYTVCLKLTDTCLSCDTTICRTFQYRCQNLSVDCHPYISLNVYPNPANSQLNITCPDCQGTYHIFDLNGQWVTGGEFAEGTNSIDLSDWAPGVYVLRTSDSSYRIFHVLKE